MAQRTLTPTLSEDLYKTYVAVGEEQQLGARATLVALEGVVRASGEADDDIVALIAAVAFSTLEGLGPESTGDVVEDVEYALSLLELP